MTPTTVNPYRSFRFPVDIIQHAVFYRYNSRTSATRRKHMSALDPSMILLNSVVEILAVPVADMRTKLASNRTRVTVMPVSGHPGRSDASHRFGRSKELPPPRLALGCLPSDLAGSRNEDDHG
jgi:hypothetical protein